MSERESAFGTVIWAVGKNSIGNLETERKRMFYPDTTDIIGEIKRSIGKMGCLSFIKKQLCNLQAA